MRTFLPAMLLALAISPLMPDVASCQEDEAFDEAPPPRPRVMERRGRGWRSSPLVWGTCGAVLAVAIPLSIYKIVRDLRRWYEDQTREKEPWERAVAEAERKRAK